jgi:hypothetical protein
MSVLQTVLRLVTRSAACLAVCVAFSGSAQGAVIFEQGPDYHVIGYEAGGLPDGTSVAVVVLRVETVVVSGEFKVRTTVEDVLIEEGWSYRIVKPGGIDSAVEIDIFNDTCSGRFKALYKPGKTVIDGGQIKCR